MPNLNIVLGVGGGIAAYKAALLLRLFTEAGHQVTVIPTDASTNFVGVATWEALSGRPATNNVFDAVDQVNHVRIGHEADLIVVAPATADLLAPKEPPARTTVVAGLVVDGIKVEIEAVAYKPV